MSELLTVREAAKYLRMSYSTLYKLVEKQRVPALKVGGAWRLHKGVLDDWLERQCHKAQVTVLIVDDDARVRSVLEDIITTQGHVAIAVESGERAIEEMEKQQFDLVFLDLVLPGTSGVEVLEKLKIKDRKIPIALVTAYGDDNIALQAMSMGPLFLIRKPFPIEEIVKVLDLVMQAKH